MKKRKYLPKFKNSGRLDASLVIAEKKKMPTFSVKAEPQRDPLSRRADPPVPQVSQVDQIKTAKASVEKPVSMPIPEPTGPNEEQAAALAAAKEKALKTGGGSAGNSPFSGSGSGPGRGFNIGGIASAVGDVTNLASSLVKADEDSSYKQQMAVGNALMKSGNPYAMAAGAAWNALATVDQALGINVNTINKDQAAAAGISKGERLLNNVLGFLPGTGAGAFAGDTQEALTLTEEAKSLGSAFSGSMSDMNVAQSMAGKTYLFGKRKANTLISESNRNNKLMTEMSRINTQRKSSDYGSDLAQQNLNRYSGNNYLQNRIGKEGMKLMSAIEVRNILRARKAEEVVKAVQAFKEGGVIGMDTNVVPEGKLHAHLNHLDEVNPDLEVTRKGIPVVVKDDSGELVQCAEVEVGEIVLTKALTDRLEALLKIGDDAAMVEAGKILAKELVTNTQDNSGELLEISDGNEDN